MEIVHLSTWEVSKLYFLTIVFGMYMILKRTSKWAFNRRKFFLMKQRDKPPHCHMGEHLGKHSFIKLKGVKFHYIEAGNPQKPLLLLLHGFPDYWLSWREQISLFSEYYRVVAVDLKGFGDSEKPLNRSAYKLEILIDELKEFVFALGVKSCTLIGHDLGGLLGWYMAALNDDLVTKFIAVSSPHPNLYWNENFGEEAFDKTWLHFSRLPILPEIEVLKEDLSAISDTFKHLQLNASDYEKNYLEAYKYTFSRKEDWTGPINYYRNLPCVRLKISEFESMLVKSLLIIGSLDNNVSLQSMVQSSEYVEKCSLKVIVGAKHFPHQEMPDAVNEAILKFLIGTPPNTEKSPEKSIVSSWLSSLSSTMKYSNQVIDAVQKRTNGVVNGLPGKILYLSQSHT